MIRVRVQRVGSFRRVPSYCYPTRRQFPTRWFLTLTVALAWLWVLDGQRGEVRTERPRPTVVEAVNVSLVTPEIDGALAVGETLFAPALAPGADATAESAGGAPFVEERAPGLALVASPAASHRAPGLAARPDREGGPDRGARPGLAPPAALPAGPRIAQSRPGRAASDPDAVAANDLAGHADDRLPRIASGLRALARDTSPVSYDCLRLCGRGPPPTGATV